MTPVYRGHFDEAINQILGDTFRFLLHLFADLVSKSVEVQIPASL